MWKKIGRIASKVLRVVAVVLPFGRGRDARAGAAAAEALADELNKVTRNDE